MSGETPQSSSPEKSERQLADEILVASLMAYSAPDQSHVEKIINWRKVILATLYVMEANDMPGGADSANKILGEGKFTPERWREEFRRTLDSVTAHYITRDKQPPQTAGDIINGLASGDLYINLI